jgi:hypothetical protein
VSLAPARETVAVSLDNRHAAADLAGVEMCLDVIVCWRHNWPDCPPHLEVVELPEVIKSLSHSEE